MTLEQVIKAQESKYEQKDRSYVRFADFKKHCMKCLRDFNVAEEFIDSCR